MAYVRCRTEIHRRLKVIAAGQGVSMQALVEQAVAPYLSGQSPPKADDKGAGDLMHIPQEMQGVVEWILDLFGRKGTPEMEALKDSLRELATERSSLKHPKKKRNAS